MKKIQEIQEIQKGSAKKIVDATFGLFEKATNFAELTGQYSGCMGMLHSGHSSMDILPFELEISFLKKETINFLSNTIKDINHDHPVMTKGSTSGFLHHSGAIFCFGSPIGLDYNLAAAVVYGASHELKEKVGVTEDDSFCDILLCNIGEWQEAYAPDNKIIVLLAKTVFKPEALLVA